MLLTTADSRHETPREQVMRINQRTFQNLERFLSDAINNIENGTVNSNIIDHPEQSFSNLDMIRIL